MKQPQTLDALSEKLVQQAIEKLVKGRTVVVIAHRLSTVQVRPCALKQHADSKQDISFDLHHIQVSLGRQRLKYRLVSIMTNNGQNLKPGCPFAAAQQIVVLDGGRVAEIGTHDGLVEKNGLYAELVSTQSLSLSLSV